MLQNDIEISLKKRKTKSRNMVVNDIKILPKMKNKSQLSKGKCRKIKTNCCHCYKSHVFLNDVDIDNIFVSRKISYGEKNYKYL